MLALRSYKLVIESSVVDVTYVFCAVGTPMFFVLWEVILPSLFSLDVLRCRKGLNLAVVCLGI